jgi:hypothetical protein
MAEVSGFSTAACVQNRLSRKAPRERPAWGETSRATRYTERREAVVKSIELASRYEAL